MKIDFLTRFEFVFRNCLQECKIFEHGWCHFEKELINMAAHTTPFLLASEPAISIYHLAHFEPQNKHLPCERHFPMHWPTSTLVSNLVPLKKTCSEGIRWHFFSRDVQVQLRALVTSRTSLKDLTVFTSAREAVQKLVPGQSFWKMSRYVDT